MAKKVPGTITGKGKNTETSVVQKSRPLLELCRRDISLSAFKILDIYLARINSHDPENRRVVLTKGEIESILGVQQIHKKPLDKRLEALKIYVEVCDSDNRIRNRPLWNAIDGDLDSDGLWTLTLECHEDVAKYFFNIDELGYLRYRLQKIINLTSRYSYTMFIYLEDNRFRKSWEIALDDLKKILSCDSSSYDEFKIFNNRVLKRCQKELAEKSDYHFSYTPIKRGRVVVAIRFTLETLSDTIEPAPEREELPGQTNLFDFDDMAVIDDNAIYAEALPPEFTAEEVEAIRSLAAPIVPHKASSNLPPECEVANYLRHKTKLMEAASRGKVKNKFKYLLAMIQKDIDEQG